MTNLSVKKIPKEPNLRFPEFKGEWEEFALEQITNIKRGKRLIKKQLSELPNEKNPYYVASGGIEPLGYYHSHNSTKETITIVCAGSIGNVFFHKEKFWCSDSSVKLNIKEEFDLKINILFLFYSLKKMEKQIKTYKIGSANPGMQLHNIYNLTIQLSPSLQ